MVIEELEPFLAEGVRLSGISIIPSGLPRVGELSPAMVEHAIRRGQGRLIPTRNDHQPEPIPARPPVLCPGCPHRGVFHVLRKMKLTVSGDIGCYTLGALPPLNAMDIFMCMGASVGMALGMEKANPANAKKTVAVIGDSTFLHSGMTGLLDMVYNRSTGTVLVLDNGTTAMTGHQDHPATGKTLMGEQTIQADIELIARGLGVRRVKVVDPFDTVGLESILKEELTAPEVSVVIARHPCVLIEKTNEPAIVCNDDLCRGCKICIGLGCPAMSMEDGKVQINEALCTGCALCADICPFDALQKGERK
jgi:indolepyruvate ferredoxin oxidoreductase alpha subunit